MVRCARCTHEWRAEPPEVPPPPPPPDLIDSPGEVRPVPAGSNLPALRKKPWLTRRSLLWGAGGATILLVLGALTGMLVARISIMEKFPVTVAYYEALGLKAADPGKGLAIENVHSEQRLQDGAIMLVVEGQIVNKTSQKIVMPRLVAKAVSPEQKTLTSWDVDGLPDKLIPGEVATFSSSVQNPDESVAEVSLTFVEHDDH